MVKNRVPSASVVSGSQHKSVASSQNKSSTKSDTTPMLSNITPKIFTSEAANIYYNAMKREGSKISDGGTIGKMFGGMSMATSKAAAKAEKASEGQCSLDQLVDEVLAVAKTPEEVALYLLAQNDSGIDKKSLYLAIIDKMGQQERDGNNNNNNSRGQRRREIIANTKEVNKAAVAASPWTIPPVTSFEHSTSGVLSTTSSITQNTGYHEEEPALATVTMEERKVPEIEEDVPLKNISNALSNIEKEEEQGPNAEESIEYDLGSYNNVAIDDIASGVVMMHGSSEKEEEARPQQQSADAADANDDLAEKQVRRKNGESGVGHTTKVNNVPLGRTGSFSIANNPNKISSRMIRAARSMSPGLLQMQERQQQREQSANNNCIDDDASNKSAGSNSSGIGHAIKVNDALSQTGSFSMISKKNEYKDSSKKTLRGLRSMSPSLLKNNFVESQPSTDEQQLKVTLSGNEKDTFATPMTKINRSKLHAVGSMSPLLFGREQMIIEEDSAADDSGNDSSESKDNSTSTASTTASSDGSLSMGSSTSNDSERPIEKADGASSRGMFKTSPVGILDASPMGMACKIRRCSSLTSEGTQATPIIANKYLTKNGKEKEDAIGCTSSLESRSVGGESKGSSNSKHSRSTSSKESKLSKTKKNNSALLSPRIPSRLPVPDTVSMSATAASSMQ